MRKAQSNENVLGHIISKKFLLVFIHSLAQRYAHFKCNTPLITIGLIFKMLKLTRLSWHVAKLHSMQRTCANVNYDTHNVVFRKIQTMWKQIADLLAVNVNYYESLHWWDWHFKEINLDLCKPTEMCVQICKHGRIWENIRKSDRCHSHNLCGLFKLETIFEPWR